VFSGFLVFSDFAHYRVASHGLRSVLVCYPLNEIRARLSAVAKKEVAVGWDVGVAVPAFALSPILFSFRLSCDATYQYQFMALYSNETCTPFIPKYF
jgi:hypothetical protein